MMSGTTRKRRQALVDLTNSSSYDHAGKRQKVDQLHGCNVEVMTEPATGVSPSCDIDTTMDSSVIRRLRRGVYLHGAIQALPMSSFAVVDEEDAVLQTEVSPPCHGQLESIHDQTECSCCRPCYRRSASHLSVKLSSQHDSRVVSNHEYLSYDSSSQVSDRLGAGPSSVTAEDDSSTCSEDNHSLPATQESLATVASIDSCGSQGFVMLDSTDEPQDLTTWRRASWPCAVEVLEAQQNRSKLQFKPKPVGRVCDCSAPCTAGTCRNATTNRYCCELNCKFNGSGSNSLRESDSLELRRNQRTFQLGVFSIDPIPAGTVIGEYFGYLQHFGSPSADRAFNGGFRLQLNTRDTEGRIVGLMLRGGGRMRFVNHHCHPNARFHEVQVGEDLTVVCATIRDIFPGDEVTLSYGNKLWFVCRCGWWGCQHRHLQDQVGPDA